MDDDKCPLQYHEFKTLDHGKMCPSFSAVLKKTPDQGITAEDLPMLQSDLETLLAAVNRRTRLLESENKALTDWCDRKDKKGSRQKELEILNSLKRCTSGEERGSKKQKLDEKGTNLAQKVKGNKKNNKDYFDQDEESSTLKSKPIDAPNRFWAMVEPYCADITLEDLKFLEDSIKLSDDDQEYYKVPPLGKHFSEKWAMEDIQEEQELGRKAGEKKQLTLKSSNVDNVTTTTGLNQMMKKAPENGNLPADETCPFGPLTQRLISAFVEENIIAPITEEQLESKGSGEGSKVPPGIGGSKLMHVPHARTLEVKIRQELAAQGIIEKTEDTNDGGDESDEVLNELKKRQAELQALVTLNQKMKQELLEAAHTEMRKQELRHRVQLADAEVLEWFRKFSSYKQNKKSPTKREREMASNALRERETILRVLNSEEL